MSTSNLPLIGLSAKCAEVSKIPEDVSDHLEVSAPHPELMYTPIDLELAEGVDVGKQAVRWRSRKRKAPRVRRRAKATAALTSSWQSGMSSSWLYGTFRAAFLCAVKPVVAVTPEKRIRKTANTTPTFIRKKTQCLVTQT